MVTDYIKNKAKKLYHQIRKFIVHDVLHADDPPHKLALGLGLGIFVTFTPTIGFQMMIVLALCWIFKANKTVGVPLVWISNPLTLGPIYLPSYWFGSRLLGTSMVNAEFWESMKTPPEGWWASTQYYWGKLMEIAAPLFLGSIVLSTILGLLTYFIAYQLIRLYRIKRWGQIVPPADKYLEKEVVENKAKEQEESEVDKGLQSNKKDVPK